MSLRGFFEIFWIKLRTPPCTFFSLRIFLYYIDMHMEHKREKCTLLHLYISRAVKVGEDCLWECEVMRGPLPWVLVYIPLLLNVCEKEVHVQWKYRQSRRFHVIFARKYFKNFQKNNNNGHQFQKVVEPCLLYQ